MLNKKQKKEIDRLTKRDGTITTDAIIESAKNPKSSLHGKFQWDVNQAAYDAWTNTARSIIHDYRLIVTTEHRTLTFRPPAYVHDPDLQANEPGYKSTVVIKDSKTESRRALLTKAQMCLGHLTALRDLGVYWEFDSSLVNEAMTNISDFVEEISGNKKTKKPKDGEVVVGLE